MTNVRRAVMVLLLTAGLAGCGSDDADSPAGRACTFEGRTYPGNVSWMAADGCNECWCVDGSVGCSGLPCYTPVQTDVRCLYDGQEYAFGVTFPSTDGCNICECTWRWYHDANPGLWEAACTSETCGDVPGGSLFPPGAAVAAACVYNGTTYPTDVYFPSADGCDECHCRTDGLVTCTFLHTSCRRDASN